MSLTNYALIHGDGCDDLGITACESCPLPACRFDLPPGVARALMVAARLAALRRHGLTLEEAAAVVGVSRRTAYRLRRLEETRR